MKVITTCLYCNHKDTFYVYTTEQVEDRKCDKCGDKGKRVHKYESVDVFGYSSDKPKPDAYIKKDD